MKIGEFFLEVGKKITGKKEIEVVDTSEKIEVEKEQPMSTQDLSSIWIFHEPPKPKIFK